jgi:hypothetical protein
MLDNQPRSKNMSGKSEVWLAIPVQVPNGLVNDRDIESDLDDEILLEKTVWGSPIVLKGKPE